MNAHATRFKRSAFTLSVAVTLTTGGLTTFDVHEANAGFDRRCNLIEDEVDEYRCVGRPMPQ